jgi:hypothetical protein
MFCGECGRSVTVEQLLSDRHQREYLPTPVETESHALIQPDTAAPLPDNFDTGTMEHVRLEAMEAARPQGFAPVSHPAPASDFAPAEPESWSLGEPAVSEPVAATDLKCEHCGATLAPSDIFCGECGSVARTVSENFGQTGAVSAASLPAAAPMPPTPTGEDVAPVDLAWPKLAPPLGERFTLQFSTGESFTVSGTGLVGRNPKAEPGEFFDQIVRVIDPSRSVSKTHLEFGQTDGEFWVHDRYSGNGTIIHNPNTNPVRCRPEKRYRTARGARIEIGEQFFMVS